MKKQLLAIVMTSLLAGTAVAAVPTTVTEKTDAMETVIYGSVQEGAIIDRVNQLDTTIYGAEKSGNLNDKVDQLYMDVNGDENHLSLETRLNVLEYTYQQQISSGSMLGRLDKLDRSVFGKIKTGTVESRIEALNKAINGDDFVMTPQMGTLEGNTVFSISLDEAVSSRTNKAGDQIPFTVVDSLMDGDILLVPAGTKGVATITEIKKARSFGRKGKLEMTFDNIKAVDGTEFTAIQGQEAQDKTKDSIKAAGASVAGAVLLGPVGLVGGAFIKGKNIEYPANATVFVQAENTTMIQGVVIGGDGLNHAKDLDNSIQVEEEPIVAPTVDAINGDVIDDAEFATTDADIADENTALDGSISDEDVMSDDADFDSEVEDTDDSDDLASESVVSEPKSSVSVSQPIVVVKRD